MPWLCNKEKEQEISFGCRLYRTGTLVTSFHFGSSSLWSIPHVPSSCLYNVWSLRRWRSGWICPQKERAFAPCWAWVRGICGISFLSLGCCSFSDLCRSVFPSIVLSLIAAENALGWLFLIEKSSECERDSPLFGVFGLFTSTLEIVLLPRTRMLDTKSKILMEISTVTYLQLVGLCSHFVPHNLPFFWMLCLYLSIYLFLSIYLWFFFILSVSEMGKEALGWGGGAKFLSIDSFLSKLRFFAYVSRLQCLISWNSCWSITCVFHGLSLFENQKGHAHWSSLSFVLGLSSVPFIQG